jgi:hypothetical protein
VNAVSLLAPEGERFNLAMETFDQSVQRSGAMAAGLMQRCPDDSDRRTSAGYGHAGDRFGTGFRRMPTA